MVFTGDELILALVSLVRATRPGMLRQEADGFTVDFEAIARSKEPGKADRLLLKMGGAMQNNGSAETAAKPISLELDASEARQIAEALEKLEALRAWPKDVMEMSRAMRVRLIGTG